MSSLHSKDILRYNICRLRVELKWSVPQIAKMLAISEREYLRVEGGKILPSLQLVDAIARVFSVTTAFLRTGSESVKIGRETRMLLELQEQLNVANTEVRELQQLIIKLYGILLEESLQPKQEVLKDV